MEKAKESCTFLTPRSGNISYPSADGNALGTEIIKINIRHEPTVSEAKGQYCYYAMQFIPLGGRAYVLNISLKPKALPLGYVIIGLQPIAVDDFVP